MFLFFHCLSKREHIRLGGASAFAGLCLDINRNSGFEIHGEAVPEDGNLLNQAADQSLIILCDSSVIDAKAVI